jgi:hypothetical protein
MKILSLLLIIVAIALSEEGAKLEQTKSVTIKCPSDIRKGGKGGSTPYSLGFVLGPVIDFRGMYCDSSTLNARVASGVCLIDLGYDSQLDIKLSGPTTLRGVLRMSGHDKLMKWNVHSQHGIVVISERAILANNHKIEFLDTKISPGDFIVVGVVD